MKNKAVIQAIILCCLPVVFLCSSNVKVYKYDDKTRVKKEDIDVYVSEEAITSPYKEIGTIIIEDEKRQNDNELLQMALKRAQELGADGIIIQPKKKKTVTYIPFDQADLSLHKRVMVYIAIEYVELKK